MLARSAPTAFLCLLSLSAYFIFYPIEGEIASVFCDFVEKKRGPEEGGAMLRIHVCFIVVILHKILRTACGNKRDSSSFREACQVLLPCHQLLSL